MWTLLLLCVMYNSSQLFIYDKKPSCHLFRLANVVWQNGSIIMATWHPLFCDTSKKVRKFLANWHYSGSGLNNARWNFQLGSRFVPSGSNSDLSRHLHEKVIGRKMFFGKDFSPNHIFFPKQKSKKSHNCVLQTSLGKKKMLGKKIPQF
jgi:hypothetical protein